MATVRDRAIEKQINEAVARAQLAGVDMNDPELKDQHCGLRPCLYKEQVKGLGPLAYDANDLACVFPCGKKCHGHCYQKFLKTGDGCPFHGETCAAQGGRRRSKSSKRSTKRSKRSSKRNKRTKRSTRSKRS